MTFSDHFSAVAARYARYRPRYPAALAELLAARCEGRELAWDAGCGNGQLSLALAPHFTKVIATEPSRAQLEQAEVHDRVEYRCENAERSTLDGACVDLAIAAQAAHWFDWRAYVAEVTRVTKPHATVATVSYGILHVEGSGGELVSQFYGELASYWPPERRHVENGYRELTWPWNELVVPAIDMVEQWTRDELVGYVTTWSATQALVRAAGTTRYEKLASDLASVWPDGERRAVRWPLAIRLARR